jgi:hypothetical protein
MEALFYIEPLIDDRTIVDGCYGKNGHYPPRPEDNVWDEIVLRKIIEDSIEMEKATRKK